MTNNKSDTSGKSIINYDDGVKAAKMVAVKAKKASANMAVCGGLALHIYGLTRATKEVDILCDKPLDFKEIKKLSFGGIAYAVKVGNRIIEIDLIIRSDDIRELYESALNTARHDKDTGLRVVTPEYMVILKYLAGRGKDQIDLLWLLREDGLVNRETVNDIIKKYMGKHSFWALRDLENVYLEADLLKARDNRSK
jgi:hypothetical protein